MKRFQCVISLFALVFCNVNLVKALNSDFQVIVNLREQGGGPSLADHMMAFFKIWDLTVVKLGRALIIGCQDIDISLYLDLNFATFTPDSPEADTARSIISALPSFNILRMDKRTESEYRCYYPPTLHANPILPITFAKSINELQTDIEALINLVSENGISTNEYYIGIPYPYELTANQSDLVAAASLHTFTMDIQQTGNDIMTELFSGNLFIAIQPGLRHYLCSNHGTVFPVEQCEVTWDQVQQIAQNEFGLAPLPDASNVYIAGPYGTNHKDVSTIFDAGAVTFSDSTVSSAQGDLRVAIEMYICSKATYFIGYEPSTYAQVVTLYRNSFNVFLLPGRPPPRG